MELLKWSKGTFIPLGLLCFSVAAGAQSYRFLEFGAAVAGYRSMHSSFDFNFTDDTGLYEFSGTGTLPEKGVVVGLGGTFATLEGDRWSVSLFDVDFFLGQSTPKNAFQNVSIGAGVARKIALPQTEQMWLELGLFSHFHWLSQQLQVIRFQTGDPYLEWQGTPLPLHNEPLGSGEYALRVHENVWSARPQIALYRKLGDALVMHAAIGHQVRLWSETPFTFLQWNTDEAPDEGDFFEMPLQEINFRSKGSTVNRFLINPIGLMLEAGIGLRFAK